MDDLLIDPELKLWVILPIFAVMVLVQLARHYSSILFQPAPPKLDINGLREQQFLTYASLLYSNRNNLTQPQYLKRMQPLVKNIREHKYLVDKSEKPANAVPSLTDPQSSQALITQIRQQALTFLPQTLTMQWISAFFGEFIVMKLPFRLTTKFKSMLQASINTYDLDVRYVSSISLYFLLFVGLDGILKLFASEGEFLGNGLPMNKRAVFEQEADQLEIGGGKFVLEGVEERLTNEVS